MLGRTPGNIIAVRPMKGRVIADFEKGRGDVESLHSKGAQSYGARVPASSSACRPGLPRSSNVRSGFRRTCGCPRGLADRRAVAAAIGARLPITEPSGNMVVDIGGGTTDIAVISLGGIVYSESVKVAGDRMDDAIMNYIKKKYNLLIGAYGRTIKFEIGSAILRVSARP